MKNRADFLTNMLASVTTVLQSDEFWQKICLILTIASVSLSILFTLYQWFKSATADGKITKEEAKEGIKIAVEGATEIQNIIEEKKGN